MPWRLDMVEVTAEGTPWVVMPWAVTQWVDMRWEGTPVVVTADVTLRADVATAAVATLMAVIATGTMEMDIIMIVAATIPPLRSPAV